MFRELSVNERRVVTLLLANEFSGADCLREQFSDAMVQTIDEAGSLSFQVSEKSRQRVFEASEVIPVEGHVSINDDVLNFDLHVDQDKYLAELHVYSRYGQPVVNVIDSLSVEDIQSMVIESG